MDLTAVKNYAKLRVFDWLLCALISGGLAVNIFAGFEMTDRLSYNIFAVTAISALIQIVCFAAVFSRKTTVAAGAAGLVYLTGIIIYAKNTGAFADDANHVTAIFILVIILVNLTVCLISRTGAGILVLLIAGNLISAGAAFLEFPVINAAYYVFLFGSAVLLIYRVYFNTALRSDSGTVQFTKYFVQILCICMAALLLALTFFTFVIKPLDPPTDEIKLIQKLERSRIIQRTGIATVVTLPDEELLSRLMTDNTQSTSNPEEQKDDDSKSENSQQENDNQNENTIKDMLTDAYAIRYDFTNPLWILFVVLILLLIALPFIIKEVSKRRWFNAVCGLSNDAQAVNLYAYFMKVFSRMDMKKAGDETFSAYSDRLKRAFEPYDAGSSATFAELTDIYVKTCYGRHTVSEDELAKFKDYYSGIRAKVRKECGNIKYIFKYFTI